MRKNSVVISENPIYSRPYRKFRHNPHDKKYIFAVKYLFSQCIVYDNKKRRTYMVIKIYGLFIANY